MLEDQLWEIYIFFRFLHFEADFKGFFADFMFKPLGWKKFIFSETMLEIQRFYTSNRLIFLLLIDQLFSKVNYWEDWHLYTK